MKAIPVPVRERILKLYDQGQSTVEIAASFGYCVAAVRRGRQRFKERGTLEPQTHRCGRKTHLTQSRKERRLRLRDRRPDATLAELGARLERPTSTMDLGLTRLGGAVKKTLPAAEPSWPDVAEQSKQWPQRRAGVCAARLVFVEESGAHTQMTRRYGRSPIGQRLAWAVPHGHYRTTTMIAAVRRKGPQAPWLFGSAMDGELFPAWVKQGLAPCLQPDDVVVMDNLATHKVAGGREALEAMGARLEYLPPYSPDFNPIEPMGSKVKPALKSREPRTARQLLQAAGAAFVSVTPEDWQGFFLSAGYAT